MTFSSLVSDSTKYFNMGLTITTCLADVGSNADKSDASLRCAAGMRLVLKVQTCKMVGGLLSWDTLGGEFLDLKEFPKGLGHKAPNNLKDWVCGRALRCV